MTMSRSGDVWLLGRHRLICGDSTLPDTYTTLMNGNRANLVVTDPPYNVNVQETAGKIQNDNMPDEDFYKFLFAAFTNMEQSMRALSDVWYESQNADYRRNEHYNNSRYHMLNYHACFTHGTVEFRCFQFANPNGDRKGGLHAGELKSYIQLCLALSQMAKTSSKASPKQPQVENPKYAMKIPILSRFGKARDKPTDYYTGSDYTFLFGPTTSGKSVNEFTAMVTPSGAAAEWQRFPISLPPKKKA